MVLALDMQTHGNTSFLPRPTLNLRSGQNCISSSTFSAAVTQTLGQPHPAAATVSERRCLFVHHLGSSAKRLFVVQEDFGLLTGHQQASETWVLGSQESRFTAASEDEEVSVPRGVFVCLLD